MGTGAQHAAALAGAAAWRQQASGATAGDGTAEHRKRWLQRSLLLQQECFAAVGYAAADHSPQREHSVGLGGMKKRAKRQ